MTYGSVWVFFQLCDKKTIHIVAMHVKSSGECQGWMEVFSSESEKDKLSWNLKHHEVKKDIDWSMSKECAKKGFHSATLQFLISHSY